MNVWYKSALICLIIALIAFWTISGMLFYSPPCRGYGANIGAGVVFLFASVASVLSVLFFIIGFFKNMISSKK